MDLCKLTQHDRNALLEFEVVYDEWRQATDAWLAAEVLLWTEALQAPGSPQLAGLGNEAARLRKVARRTYLRVIDALVRTSA